LSGQTQKIEAHAISIVRIVIVTVTVTVNIMEVISVRRVRRTQPPITSAQAINTAYNRKNIKRGT